MTERILTIAVPKHECLHCVLALTIKAFYGVDAGNKIILGEALRALGDNIGELAAQSGALPLTQLEIALRAAIERGQFISGGVGRPPAGHA